MRLICCWQIPISYFCEIAFPTLHYMLVSGWLVVSFTALPNLRSHQDEYGIVTMHTHGDVIVLSTGKSSSQNHDLISHSVTLSCHRTNQSLPYSINASTRLGSTQVSIFWVIGLTWRGTKLTIFAMRGSRSTNSATVTGKYLYKNAARLLQNALESGGHHFMYYHRHLT